MKCLTVVVTLGSALFIAGCSTSAEDPAPAAPAATTAPQPATDVTAIEALEREWVAAIVKKDTAALERLLAKDFVGTSPTAHTYTRELALSDMARGTYVVTAMDLDEVSATLYGDTAVAFTSQEEKSTYDGVDTSGHYHYTNVWVRRDGTWQVVASHGSRYAQKHG
jgi:ketosteroid isomerase-like protein